MATYTTERSAPVAHDAGAEVLEGITVVGTLAGDLDDTDLMFDVVATGQPSAAPVDLTVDGEGFTLLAVVA